MIKKKVKGVDPNITPKKMAPKYEKQGQSKIINSYGAVGTLIQTLNNGSLLIDQFDNWEYYKYLVDSYNGNAGGVQFVNNSKHLFAHDPRLLNRIRTNSGNQINALFKMPLNIKLGYNFGNQILVDDKPPHNPRQREHITAKFFPRWFYCPGCGTLKHLSQWGVNNEYPRCFNNHGNFGIRLEQFSFCLASESGKIADIPWSDFLTKNGDRINFDINNPSNNLVLNYSTGGSAERLETKRVIGNGISKSLGSLPSKTFIDQNENEYQMVIRQGNNLCFVQTLSSVFIPEYEIPSEELQSLRSRIRTMEEDGDEITAQRLLAILLRIFPDTGTEISHIEKLLTPEDDNEYKKHEFDFMLNAPDI